MSKYSYITAPELATLIKSGAVPNKEYAIVDVRDEDFDGGNIPGAIRAPSDERTEESVTDLVKGLRDVPQVIFHCVLSQVRGPKAARIYAEEVARQSTLPSSTASSNLDGSPSTAPVQQKILVLVDGFAGWQATNKDDPELVEKYNDKIWKGFVA